MLNDHLTLAEFLTFINKFLVKLLSIPLLVTVNSLLFPLCSSILSNNM